MDRRVWLASAATLLAGSAAAASHSPPRSARTRLTLGTSPLGGGFTPFGDAFAATVMERDPGLAIEPVYTKGSTENIPLLEAGRLDLGLAGGEPTHEALTGLGRTPARIKIIAPMYPSAGMFVTPGASRARTIADLKGRPVIFGAAGSGLVVLARYVLAGLGLDMDKDFRPILLERDDLALPMLLDGRAAGLWGGGVAWPAFSALAHSPGGARFIVPDDRESAAILARFPFLKRLTVAPHTYAGQEQAIVSIGSWSVVLARAAMDDAIAYRLAKAVHEGEASMAARVASGRETRSINTWVAAARPADIHPGVLRYLHDAGLVPA